MKASKSNLKSVPKHLGSESKRTRLTEDADLHDLLSWPESLRRSGMGAHGLHYCARFLMTNKS